jgi:hypothetical protein
MLMVTESSRKFPLQELSVLDLSQDDFFERMLSIKRANCPSWTDESASDFGIQLLWMFSVMSQWMAKHVERVGNNLYIGTTLVRENMRRLCELIGYQMQEMAPAVAVVTFAFESGHPEFTLYKGTKVSTSKSGDSKPLLFEVNSDQLITVGLTTKDVSCTQGETISNSVLGSSEGVVRFSVPIQRTGVIWESETVEIYYNETWNEWTRVDNFIDSTSTSIHYRVKTDDSGYYSIEFGNGINGQIPPIGVNNIRATYRVGNGTTGNVSIETIVELVNTVAYVDSVTNAAVASGGLDEETIEHARLFAPLSIKTLDRIVTRTDIESLVEGYTSSTYGGVAKAKAYDTLGVVINVMIVPHGGGFPSSGLKTDITNYLDTRRMVCTSIRVLDPEYQLVSVTADVYIFDGYNPSDIAARVRNNIVAHVSPHYQDPITGLYPHSFGRNINISDLYRVMDSTSGVDYCDITLPTSNVIVPDYRIADIGTISITVVSTDGVFSFANLGVK